MEDDPKGLNPLGCLLAFLLSGAFTLFGGLVVSVVWNTLSPLFGGPVMDYTQGLAAFVLLSIVGNVAMAPRR